MKIKCEKFFDVKQFLFCISMLHTNIQNIAPHKISRYSEQLYFILASTLDMALIC